MAREVLPVNTCSLCSWTTQLMRLGENFQARLDIMDEFGPRTDRYTILMGEFDDDLRILRATGIRGKRGLCCTTAHDRIYTQVLSRAENRTEVLLQRQLYLGATVRLEFPWENGYFFFRWVVARIESGPGCIMLAWDDTTSESRVFWKGWAGAPTAAPNFPLYFLLFCFWEGFSWKLASASIALLNAENWKASISICRRNFWYEINDDIMRDRPV